MKKAIAGTLLLFTTLLIPQLASAGVYMCVDPVTGKKTFTDRACPTAAKGTKVRVQATNFGRGVKNTEETGTWRSERDTSVAGRANLREDKPQVAGTPSSTALAISGS